MTSPAAIRAERPPLHQPPPSCEDPTRRPAVVRPPASSGVACEVCGCPALAPFRHWSGAILDLCATCLGRTRRTK